MSAKPASKASAEPSSPGRLIREGGVAWLVLDDPAKKVNTLSTRLFGWFDDLLSQLESDPPRALVLISGKPESFIVGADIDELKGLDEAEPVLRLVKRGHRLSTRFEELPFPKVAAIHGACLGGGLELALCCDRLIATEHPKTRLGLPEVQLGIIPGMGGTQRLPRRIGVPDALDLILTGKQIDARRARKLGLVDETCHPTALRQAVERMLPSIRPSQAGGGSRTAGRSGGGSRLPMAKRAGDLLARSGLGDRLVFDKARAKVDQKTGGHYPAPRVALEVIRDGIGLPLPRALDVEAGAFTELVLSETATHLMSIFFMKNDAEARAAKLASAAREVEQIGVLGAGFMGAGVAQVLAAKGMRVVMKDRDLAGVGRGLAFAQERFDELVSRRRMRSAEAELAMGRLHGTADYAALRRADFVVEAVFEDLELKRRVLREVEEIAPESLIFASNTSTLPIAGIAEASRRPEQVVGMHFFSPVHKMPLVEVIRHPGSSEEAVATTVEIARRMGKTVITVNDEPGFFTSRVLMPFINEAAWLLTDGASVEQIDGAVKAWGWPVGPIALLDEVGLDVAHHANQVMIEAFGDRLSAPEVLGALRSDGRTGRKGGRGFYLYDESGGGKSVDESLYERIGWQAREVSGDEIAERCWLQMLNEVARTIEDGIIENPVDIDIGVIFGFGFPPFRGGILRQADKLGLDRVVELLEGYAARHGDRLAPAQLLRDMARSGERFHRD